jgi:predicted house-cleaning noncanonical NTP pyrophosphatase (MazG superfamily)
VHLLFEKTNNMKQKEKELFFSLFKKEMRNKIAQEAAAYVMKKAIEKLPDLIARIV